MSLNNIWNIKSKEYQKYYEYTLAILASVLIFREFATICIVLFLFINILFYSRIKMNRRKWVYVLIISIPIILDFLFLWNNESLIEGVKNGEKHLTTFIFPLLIIGQRFTFDTNKILKIYSAVFTIVLLFFLAIHIMVSFNQFEKYLMGIEVWRMGYQYALSMGLHAPVLNMHIAFIVVINFYLLLIKLIKNKKFDLLRFSLFFASLFLLLIVNTRLAVVNAILGIFFTLSRELFKKTTKKAIIKIVSTTVLIISLLAFLFINTFPYYVKKYTEVTFTHLDKIGKLDEIENPEAVVYSSLVTRLSVWKTTWDVSKQNLLFGVGAADARQTLIQAYKDSDQIFLAKYKFAVHNQYLDFLLKYGVIGLTGILLYVFNILRIGWKSKRTIPLFFFLTIFCL